MQRLRAGIGWLAGWLAVSAAVATGLVAYTLAQGGAIHRVPVCRGPDANIFSIGIVAAAASAILVLAWWALGASSVRWRWVRVILVALASPVIAVAGVLGPGMFSVACTGGPIMG